jgi:hypothetical protein
LLPFHNPGNSPVTISFSEDLCKPFLVFGFEKINHPSALAHQGLGPPWSGDDAIHTGRNLKEVISCSFFPG